MSSSCRLTGMPQAKRFLRRQAAACLQADVFRLQVSKADHMCTTPDMTQIHTDSGTGTAALKTIGLSHGR